MRGAFHHHYSTVCQKPQNSAIFSNWHGPCNPVFIRRKGRWETRQGIDEMTTTSFSQRVFAAFAAFGMTSFMLVSYFYVPASHVVPGIVA